MNKLWRCFKLYTYNFKKKIVKRYFNIETWKCLFLIYKYLILKSSI